MLPPLHVDTRADLLRSRLLEAGVGAAVITSRVNIRWLTGFTGSSAVVVVGTTPDSPLVLVTDGRYGEQAMLEGKASQADLRVEERRTQAEIHECVSRWMVEFGGTAAPTGLETSDISLAEFDVLASAAAAVGGELTRDRILDIAPIFNDLRRTKSTAEVARIASAARIADAALGEIGSVLEPGTTEREIRDALDAAMRRHGADDVSFPTIVACGENSALPHHRPTERVLRPGDSIVIDFGALVEGYHSDMTRTFIVSGPGSEEMLDRHFAVRAACEAGVAEVAPGALASDVDSACRRVLAGAGLEAELTHGVGHGVGLLIHEAPWVNARSRDILRPGDVVTVEPGAYRVGFGGARVEELLLVTDTGHLVLSNSPKEPTCPPSPPMTSRTE